MSKPNVILVMTDDQGYGDLGCTGNPWIQTPNIDRFSKECTRLVDFHVSPLCTPTRGALMTGHLPVRNGAWATTWGRHMLRRSEVTMADVFRDSGYRTGMFGKWHLGDCYPYRPQDRGFETVVAHKGGGVGQTPDFWNNTYFDDTYFVDGGPQKFDGYCTDIWFDQAMKFIEANEERPFFCYLATNAPHAPYRVAGKYSEPYADNDSIPEPAFYGMITNIDENMGRLIARLDELGLRDDTVLIFMTDNGSSGGYRDGKGYNAGMRGIKGSYYDGGHRVPFFIRWPEGGIEAGRDAGELIRHVDLLPTFIDLCGLDAPPGVKFDGASAAAILRGEAGELPGDRVHFVQQRQSMDPPEKWVNAVMTRRWRLINGEELYDIKADPGQQSDVAAGHRDVVARLRAAHEAWWDEVSPTLDEPCRIVLGLGEANPVRLDAFDLMGDVAWDQSQVRAAMKCCGTWAVDVERAGRYEFTLRRWPEEADAAVAELVPDVLEGRETLAISAVGARLNVAGCSESAPVDASAKGVTFAVELATGEATVEAEFIDEAGEAQAAYYVYVRRL